VIAGAAANQPSISARCGSSFEGLRRLLVTSAFHMPRAVGAFRAEGLAVIAAPTDWQIDPHAPWQSWSAAERLRLLDLSIKEYLGMLAYYLTGRIPPCMRPTDSVSDSVRLVPSALETAFFCLATAPLTHRSSEQKVNKHRTFIMNKKPTASQTEQPEAHIGLKKTGQVKPPN
jgi:hypothetical protein